MFNMMTSFTLGTFFCAFFSVVIIILFFFLPEWQSYDQPYLVNVITPCNHHVKTLSHDLETFSNKSTSMWQL